MSPFKFKVLKFVSVYLIINIFAEILFPTVAFALTSGPAQPEFSSFEPIATTNMVNEFTGDFTYNLPVINVPGPNGSGYAASLSYHSGGTMEEEASWVGYGWTLNPGAINRGKNGLPDDYNGEPILHSNKVPKNWTASTGARLGLEFFSADLVSVGGVSVGGAVRYNNYKGFGTSLNIGVSAYEGLASVNYSVSGEDGHSFSADINPAALVAGLAREKNKKVQKGLIYNKQYKSKTKKQYIATAALKKMASLNYGSQYGILSLFGVNDTRTYTVSNYNGMSVNIAFGLAGTPTPLEWGFEVGLNGSYSEQTSPQGYDRIGYGYMYLKNWNSSGSVDFRQADYRVEKETPFNKRDKFLPIPYCSPDQFTVTGEGIGGGFRLYNSSLGHVKPTQVLSTTSMSNVGLDINVGAEFGAGFNVGAGEHTLKSSDWKDEKDGNTKEYKFSSANDEQCFFRFSGDLGGNVEFSDNDDAYQASMLREINVPGVKRYNPWVDQTKIYKNLNGRPGRSSYIGYHTNNDMIQSQPRVTANGGSIYYKSYTQEDPNINGNTDIYSSTIPGRYDVEDVREYVNTASRTALQDRIGEIATYNADGNRYVYGLPIYAAFEKSLSVSVKEPYSNMPTVNNNYIVYKGITGNTEVGEVSPSAYATSFLLTQITTPDYIDRNFDGPTPDDFGGWTKFNYRRLYGNVDKSSVTGWFKWRFPYNGLAYERHELCDPRDDMGAFTSGYKEMYLMKSIETKSHVAYFITNKTNLTVVDANGNSVNLKGSLIDRKDGFGATLDDAQAAMNSTSQNNSQKQERLEKIILYAKNENNKISGKPLKIVHFEYYDDGTDYNSSKVLCKDLLNSDKVYSNNKNAGKLTLRKVWFEHEGVVSSKITPYEFKYEYKKSTDSDFQSLDLKSKYSSIIAYGDNFEGKENPDYNIYNIDNWGQYCPNGATRHKYMKNWVNQAKPDPTFDPAVWQLKVIKLPSGGEILIQYEQHDYNFVQDQPALAMVSLINSNKTVGSKDEKGSESSINKYYLNLNDIDIDQDENNIVDDTELNALASRINTYLENGNKKIYFKFLYTLIGDIYPEITGCGVDYISGYMNATATADLTNKGIYISFSGNNSYKLPRQVCKDFVTRTKSGLNITTDCNEARDAIGAAANLEDQMNIVRGLINRLSTDFTGGSNNCKSMSLENSYIRIPLLKAKKGGGIRVKRLLMFDKGLEPGQNGDETLIGTEYFYVNEDGTSSGVASNEPPSTREENALVNFLDKRATQSLYSKIVSGKDKDNFEGPIGEELLPPASIGYSRIVSQNIHTGKSGTGFKVSEYYTTWDYPLSKGVYNTEIDEAKDYLPLPAIWVNLNTNNKWVTQGYSFVLNSMNGQLERIASYIGNYMPGENMDTYTKSYEEVHEYFTPGEKVPVLDENGNIDYQYMGKEMDVTMESRSLEDIQSDGSVQIDAGTGIALFIPLFQFSIFPYLAYNEKKLRAHVTNKITRYPCILKKTTTTRDGIVHIEENKVFNKFTGDPIAKVITDGYDGLVLDPNSSDKHNGSYTNYTIPASYVYKQLGQKATNERFKKEYNSSSIALTSVGNGAYSFNIPSSDSDLLGKKLIDGDLVRLKGGSLDGLFYISGYTGTLVNLKALSMINVGSGSFTELEVINSGYTNQLNLDAGTITTYGTDYSNDALPPSPINVSGNIVSQKTFVNGISSTAKTYSDLWSNESILSDYGITPGSNMEYETGERGKWRFMENYVFRISSVKDAVTGSNRVYSASGTAYIGGFNYSSPSSNTSNYYSGWIRTNKVNSYSPHGNALEEQDALGIYSSARFGYNENVPVLIAKNAPYSSVLFTGFEDEGAAVNTTAHSGSYSKLLASNSEFTVGNIQIDIKDGNGNPDRSINSKGVSVKFWIKQQNDINDDINNSFQCIVQNNALNVFASKLNKIARVGEWTLCEAKFANLTFDPYSALTIKLKNTGKAQVWVDDVRVQPVEAQMVCYVYDRKNLRLLTSFDDQHFGLYYQYNGEGKLLRKLVETERGLKTIQETQYNTKTIE